VTRRGWRRGGEAPSPPAPSWSSVAATEVAKASLSQDDATMRARERRELRTETGERERERERGSAVGLAPFAPPVDGEISETMWDWEFGTRLERGASKREGVFLSLCYTYICHVCARQIKCRVMTYICPHTPQCSAARVRDARASFFVLG
jgi:hypothetical protein